MRGESAEMGCARRNAQKTSRIKQEQSWKTREIVIMMAGKTEI